MGKVRSGSADPVIVSTLMKLLSQVTRSVVDVEVVGVTKE